MVTSAVLPPLTMIGVPSSAGSYAAGQDQAPRALRDAGLVTALLDAGIEVHDAGDLTEQVWAPDRDDRLAQNLGQVVTSVQELADRVPELLTDDRRLLVLGGNCTVAVGMLAGLNTVFGPCGLLYVDRHFDMNTPESTTEGALDWMGLAHALDLPGSRDEFAGAFATRPVLDPPRLALLGTDPAEATDFERAQVAALDISVTTQADMITDPAAAATVALGALPDAPFAVHVDVDVLDFTDAPIAENTSGRNLGPTLDQLVAALKTVVADPRWRALSIGEINPTRTAGDPGQLTRLVAALTDILAHAGRAEAT
jgi:arginase